MCFCLYQICLVQKGRGRELRTPGTRPWSWRKSFTSTGTWRADGGSRSPMPSASLSGRSRSGSRTGGWSGRKTTSSRAWAWQQLVAEATGLDIVSKDSTHKEKVLESSVLVSFPPCKLCERLLGLLGWGRGAPRMPMTGPLLLPIQLLYVFPILDRVYDCVSNNDVQFCLELEESAKIKYTCNLFLLEKEFNTVI